MSNVPNSREDSSKDGQMNNDGIIVRDLGNGRREVSGEHFLVIGDSDGHIEDVCISDELLQAMFLLFSNNSHQ